MKAVSSIDEAIVEKTLGKPKGRPGAGRGSAPRKRPGGKPSTPTGPTRPPEGEQLSAMERLRRRRRLRALRRRREDQLQDLAGLAVELERLDSPRYQELVAERLKEAAKTDEELMALERQLAPDEIGGACPRCGLHSTQTRYCLRCGERLEGRRHDALTLPGAILAVVAIATAWLLGGVDLSSKTSPSGSKLSSRSVPGPVKPRFQSVVVSVRGHKIPVYHSPHGSPFTTLSNPNVDGAQLVFLVKSLSGKWARVYLPIRPNGSTGWIKLSGVSLAGHNYRLKVDLTKHKLVAWNGAKTILRTPIGVGRAVTPTPPGEYYITELLKQPNPNGLYGPYAFGLSAHSNALHEFAGRDAIVGLHGTNFPKGIGTNVSHGCIRMSNKAIVFLAKTLPIGTPVRIVGHA
jgi:lipoprotein-anchoring transpeptidase ErfK/SrfK